MAAEWTELNTPVGEPLDAKVGEELSAEVGVSLTHVPGEPLGPTQAALAGGAADERKVELAEREPNQAVALASELPVKSNEAVPIQEPSVAQTPVQLDPPPVHYLDGPAALDAQDVVEELEAAIERLEERYASSTFGGGGGAWADSICRISEAKKLANGEVSKFDCEDDAMIPPSPCDSSEPGRFSEMHEPVFVDALGWGTEGPSSVLDRLVDYEVFKTDPSVIEGVERPIAWLNAARYETMEEAVFALGLALEDSAFSFALLVIPYRTWPAYPRKERPYVVSGSPVFWYKCTGMLTSDGTCTVEWEDGSGVHTESATLPSSGLERYGPFPAAILGLNNKENFAITGLRGPNGERPTVRVSDDTSQNGGALLAFSGCKNFLVKDVILDGNRQGRRGKMPVGLLPDELPLQNEGQHPTPWHVQLPSARVAVLADCSSVWFDRVDFLNAPENGLTIRATPDGGAPSDIVLLDCAVLCASHVGLAVTQAHKLRVLGGSYSHTSGFWTMAGIDLESEPEAVLCPAICDVVIEGCTFNGNWKGIQVNSKRGTRWVTMRSCRVDGSVNAERFAAEGPCVPHTQAFSPKKLEHRSFGVTMAGSWLALRDSTFENFDSEERQLHGVVVVDRTRLGCVVIRENVFSRIGNRKIWQHMWLYQGPRPILEPSVFQGVFEVEYDGASPLDMVDDDMNYPAPIWVHPKVDKVVDPVYIKDNTWEVCGDERLGPPSERWFIQPGAFGVLSGNKIILRSCTDAPARGPVMAVVKSDTPELAILGHLPRLSR